ncbi:MAG: hypothetical protein ACR2JO_09880 [Mycobacteriales bacterium]
MVVSSAKTTQAGGGQKAGGQKATSLESPKPLAVDPCTLVTQAEAAQAVGGPVKHLESTVRGASVCNYFGDGTPGNLSVDTSPLFCKLLYLALKNNIFGGVQQRIDDIGDGGMLVKGGGNVQITVAGGCFTIDGRSGSTDMPDVTMLSLARIAAQRVK